MSAILEHVELETGDDPSAAVIWLHGLGADGHDFEPVVALLDLPAQLPIRFVFPHAPERAVTINAGMRMRAWYDMDPSEGPYSGEADIQASAALVEALLEREIDRGIDSKRLILAGFSQGGVMALHTGLRYRRPLAGVLALSTYLHDHAHLAEQCSFENLDTPIMMAHGLMDPMIPVRRGVSSREELLKLDYEVAWHEYAMGHEVCAQELADISRWLTTQLT
ncbi:MAG: alpha/beta fold hydrolase [Pseudomonadales bacterium]